MYIVLSSKFKIVQAMSCNVKAVSCTKILRSIDTHEYEFRNIRTYFAHASTCARTYIALSKLVLAFGKHGNQ